MDTATGGALQGEVVAVPVPRLMDDIYINLGRSHQVEAGDHFLAFNATVSAIAILRVETVQERTAVVKALAQIASLRKGDKVRRVSAEQARAFRSNLKILAAATPALANDVIPDPKLLAAAQSIGAPKEAPVPAGAPDLSDVILMARATDQGITLSWPAPASGSGDGFRLYRAGDRAELGTRLNPVPITGQSYVDGSAQPEVTYIYRLTALGPGGVESASAPSIEVKFFPKKKGTFGIGGANARAEAANLPPFVLAGGPALPVPAASPAPIFPSASPGVLPPPAPPTPSGLAPSPSGPSATAPPTPSGPSAPPEAAPDISDVILMATAHRKGVRLSWPTPAQGAQGVAGYHLYRTTDPASLGSRLTPKPVDKLEFLDESTVPGASLIYRLTAVGRTGSESGSAPSILVTYAPAAGDVPAKVAARNQPPFAGGAGTPAPVAAPPPIPPPALPALPTAAQAQAGLPAAAQAGAPASPLPSAVPPLPGEVPLPAPAGVPAAPPLPDTPPVPVSETGAGGEPALAVPRPPDKVSVTLEGTTAVVKWDPVSSKEVQIAGYVVFRGAPGAAEGTALNERATKNTVLRDRKAEPGQSYEYWVVSQSVEGTMSPPSRKEKVDVPKSGSVVPFF